MITPRQHKLQKYVLINIQTGSYFLRMSLRCFLIFHAVWASSRETFHEFTLEERRKDLWFPGRIFLLYKFYNSISHYIVFRIYRYINFAIFDFTISWSFLVASWLVLANRTCDYFRSLYVAVDIKFERDIWHLSCVDLRSRSTLCFNRWSPSIARVAKRFLWNIQETYPISDN